MNYSVSFVKLRVGVPGGFFMKMAGFLGAFLALAGVPERAEVLLSETFTYFDGPLTAVASAVWKGRGVEFPQIQVVNRKLSLRDGESGAVSALLSGQPYAEGKLYAGFTVKFSALPASSGSPFAAFTDANGARDLGRLYATTDEAAPGTVRIGLSTFLNPLNNTVPVDMVPGQEYRVMLRYEPAFLGMTVWVNPQTEESDGVRPREVFSTFPSPIASIVFRQTQEAGSGAEIMTVDGLVVATTFAEAKEAPEEKLWEYTVQNGSVTITRYLGVGPEVIIPETIEGLPVKRFTPRIFQYIYPPVENLTLPASITNLASGAFEGDYYLTNVTILGQITTIPSGTFNGCFNLVRVTYPDSVTTIGDSAFGNCNLLTEVKLPQGLTRIGDYAFRSCGRLAEVHLPPALTRIGAGAFMMCFNLARIAIPPLVTVIGDQAFRYCERLEAIEVDPANTAFASVEGILFNKAQTSLMAYPPAKVAARFAVPATVTRLAVAAFAGNSTLQEVTIPDGVTALPESAFSDCTALTSVVLPAGLTALGDYAFFGTALTRVALPAGVTRIPDYAYGSCSGLVTVSIPEQIRTLGAGAFSSCDNLTEITISRNVTSLGSESISGARLTKITVDELNTAFASVDGVLFNKVQTTLLKYPAGKSGNFQIPDGVRTIATTAFGGASLTSLVIPASVTSLQERAFDSSRLTSVVIPDTVTTLGMACFTRCEQLVSVRVGRGITTIPMNAFESCPQLSEVILPETLRTISDLAFYNSPALRRIVIPASVRTLQGYGLFDQPSYYFEGPRNLEIYFEGNAPTANMQSLVQNPYFEEAQITVYYRAGTTGWEETFAGRPTVRWDARVESEGASFGLKDGKLGFKILGTPGLVLLVEACSDLANPIWTAVGTHTLDGGTSLFADSQAATLPARFYRLRAP